MTRFATILTAAALIAGTAQVALAERPDPISVVPFGSQTEVQAGSMFSARDLARVNLKADDTISLTVAPAGEVGSSRGGDR